MEIHRELAEKLVARMRRMYSTPFEYVPAREADFAHLDLRSYGEFRAELEKEGYRYLGDFENLNVSKSPDTVIAPTTTRSMISADGRTAAGHYQIRPRMKQLWKNLVRGILNFRFFAAPTTFLRQRETRQSYDFLSEIADTFIGTSNANGAGVFSQPAAIDMAFLPTARRWGRYVPHMRRGSPPRSHAWRQRRRSWPIARMWSPCMTACDS